MMLYSIRLLIKFIQFKYHPQNLLINEVYVLVHQLRDLLNKLISIYVILSFLKIVENFQQTLFLFFFQYLLLTFDEYLSKQYL